jgi:REP element-mobilizing transposase RayT
MMKSRIDERFRGKYRIASSRLKDWDYSSPGGYFVTICTKHKKPILSRVVDEDIKLSPYGMIVADEWKKGPVLHPSVALDEYVIMPNHLHGIIIFQEIVETPRRGVSGGSVHKQVSLSAIINHFKSACTKRIRASGMTQFSWQSRFYDHIIRDEIDLGRIREYIQQNPARWMLDEYYSEGGITSDKDY